MDIRGLTVQLIALVLLLVGIAHFCLRWWMRRRAKRQDALLHRWVSRSFRETVAPLALLLWIQGLYVASRLVMPDLLSVEAADRARSALEWGYRLSLMLALFWLLLRIGRLVDAYLVSLSTLIDGTWDDVLLRVAGKAARVLLPLLALILGAPMLALSPGLAHLLSSATSLALIAVVAYLLIQVVDAAAVFILSQYRLDARDNLQARAVHTQVTVLKKVALVTVGIFTLASMLMVFEPVRQFGASILASAGIAGIIIGFAAQRSIATLLAGFQIALTQPIRVDDVVIVEGEWGRIEDITLTYVVVQVWDLRRLIVPITFFIERPFQNWTRATSDILGTVFLHVDYSVPLAELRAELTRILTASPHWDRKVNALQVTDAKAHTIEVRALASASDASAAWDLRCEIREKLIEFLQRQYPGSLPRLRATLETQ